MCSYAECSYAESCIVQNIGKKIGSQPRVCRYAECTYPEFTVFVMFSFSILPRVVILPFFCLFVGKPFFIFGKKAFFLFFKCNLKDGYGWRCLSLFSQSRGTVAQRREK